MRLSLHMCACGVRLCGSGELSSDDPFVTGAPPHCYTRLCLHLSFALRRLSPRRLCSVGDLARRYGLTAEMIGGVLAERVGPIIRGQLEAGVIYTQAYLTRIKAQLRWASRLWPWPRAGGCGGGGGGGAWPRYPQPVPGNRCW